MKIKPPEVKHYLPPFMDLPRACPELAYKQGFSAGYRTAFCLMLIPMAILFALLILK